MMINPLDPFNKVNKIGKVGNDSKAAGVDRPSKSGGGSKDSINISPEAKELLDSQKVSDIAKKAPDIRTEKINQIKKTIAEGNFEQKYLTHEVLDKVADKITDSFLGQA